MDIGDTGDCDLYVQNKKTKYYYFQIFPLNYDYYTAYVRGLNVVRDIVRRLISYEVIQHFRLMLIIGCQFVNDRFHFRKYLANNIVSTCYYSAKN